MIKRSVNVLLAELADKASWAYYLTNGRRKGNVGEYITKLPEKDRELLRELKSDDIKDDMLQTQFMYHRSEESFKKLKNAEIRK